MKKLLKIVLLFDIVWIFICLYILDSHNAKSANLWIRF